MVGAGGGCLEHFDIVLPGYGRGPGKSEVGWLSWPYRLVHSETCGLSYKSSEGGFGADDLEPEGEGVQVGLEAEVDVEGEDVSNCENAEVVAGLGIGHVGELVEGVPIDRDVVCGDHGDCGGRSCC